jgi:hypothetical protein
MKDMRKDLINAIQHLWREERAARWLNPPSELTLDLHALPLGDLQSLRQRIAGRLAGRADEHHFALPDGWWWVTPWQAWHHEHGLTTGYQDRNDALQAVRCLSPSEAAPVSAPVLQETDLFGEPVRQASGRSRRNSSRRHQWIR